ncbi:MAG TPA: hypothetical protein VIJ22_10430 [Polyangiaceae bacterium]
MLRFSAAGSFALLSALALTTACVDPAKDYDAYANRTADADFNGQSADDASFDGSGGAGFTNLSLVMACVSQLLPTIDKATYFTVTTTFNATDMSGDGTLDFSDTALALPATNIKTAVGPPATIPGSVVTGGQVNVVFGPTNVPAPASPLGSEIDFSDTTLEIRIQNGTLLCANLAGDVTSPEALALIPSENICIFAPPGPGGTVPTFTAGQVHCP